jgi:hypothetical protein
MKKLAVVLFAILISTAVFAEMKVDTQVWLDSDYGIKNYAYSSGGAFYIGRAYLGVSGDIGKDWLGNPIKGKLTLDFFNAQSGVPIKFANFDWTLFKINNDRGAEFTSLVLSAGLMKSVFGNQDYDYVMPVKPVEEATTISVCKTADYGAMISGKFLPDPDKKDGLVRYYFQLLNGEGYTTIFSSMTTTTPKTGDFAGQGTVFVSPISGLSAGGSYRYVGYNELNKKREISYALTVIARDLKFGSGEGAAVIPIDAQAEFVAMNSITATAKSGSTTANILSVMVGYGFLDKSLYPYFRIDYSDPNIKKLATVDIDRAYYFGLNVKPNKDFSLKPMISYKTLSQAKAVKLELDYKTSFLAW